MATTDFLRWFKVIKEYLAQKRLVDTTATELDDTVLSSIPGRAVCADQLQVALLAPIRHPMRSSHWVRCGIPVLFLQAQHRFEIFGEGSFALR